MYKSVKLKQLAVLVTGSWKHRKGKSISDERRGHHSEMLFVPQLTVAPELSSSQRLEQNVKLHLKNLRVNPYSGVSDIWRKSLSAYSHPQKDGSHQKK